MTKTKFELYEEQSEEIRGFEEALGHLNDLIKEESDLQMQIIKIKSQLIIVAKRIAVETEYVQQTYGAIKKEEEE